VHRDLKPDNIMIMKGRDGGDVVKVVDFGIAKASSSDAQKVTKTGLVVGTPEYMSPEQLAGDKLDGRSDIYSLGLVAFNCLTGTLPFVSNSAQEAMIMRLTDHPKSLTDMRPDVAWPAELEAVMLKALARDADERYQKAPAFGMDMVKSVENMPATVAAAAGTLVIGAAANVPATRVASPSAGGATKKVEAQSTPPSAAVTPTSSRMPLMVGAVVVLALGGGGAYWAMTGSGAAAKPAGADSTALSQGRGVPGAAGAGAPNVVAPNSSPVSNPGNVKTLNTPAATNPGPGRSGTAAVPAGSAPAPINFASELKRIQDIGIEDESHATRMVNQIDMLLPRITSKDDSIGLLAEKAGALPVIEGNTDNACKLFSTIKDKPSSYRSGILSSYKAIGCK
jgi:serine/threonine-protein kinase